jgi:hypothetical protein
MLAAMPIRITLGILCAALILVATAGSASAAITVANTNDSGPGSLRQAIAEAPPGETIDLPAGTYTLATALGIERSVTIAGHGAGDTILRGPEADRAVFVNEDGIDVRLRDLTVREFIPTAPPVIFSGGANLFLERVHLTANGAAANGGPGEQGGVVQGGLIVAAGGSLTLLDCDLDANTITANGGSGKHGGVVQGGLLLSLATLTMRGTSISGNVVQARGGAGPSNSSQGGGVVQGGLILASEGGPPAPMRIESNTISGNTADASSGAGGNGGVIQGGALLLTGSKAPWTVSGLTVAGNTARAIGQIASGDGIVQGGALLVVGAEAGSINVLGSTIAKNRTESASPTSVGANLFGAGMVSVGNTIVADGVGGAPGTQNCAPESEVKSLGFNIDSSDQCGFHSPGDKVNTPPVLEPLADNGGPVQTMALPPQSQAVDQGSAFGVFTDARGVARPIDFPTIGNSAAPGGDGSDIGAFELQPASSLTLGKVRKQKGKGTASLVATVPQPSVGTIVLSGKGLKTQAKTVAGQARLSLKIVAKGKVRKALRKKGKRKVQVKVTYTPAGNVSAEAKRKLKLVKKKRKGKKRGGK